jgi:membrane protein
MVDRDADAGGEIIAGALAYRIFIWLLPLALVFVAGLGLAADAADESTGQTIRSLGIAGLVSNSVATTAQGPARWYALLIGIPLSVYVTRSLLRALIATHRLLWGDARSASPRPTIAATLRLLGLLLVLGAASLAASALRAADPLPGLLVTVLMVLPYAGIWVLISLHLPHRGADWHALVPGALLCAIGLELLHVVAAYVLEPYAVAKAGTYGAMGAAAALLLGLFVVSRLVVAGAVLNATLWERQTRPADAAR